MTDKEKLKGIRKAIKKIIKYPTKKHGRRTDDGYPAELIYDEFAYRRIVNSYREGLQNILNDYE